MTEHCKLPSFDQEQVRNAAHQLFDLNGSISQLPGERDLNFLITTDDNTRYVLKVANHEENPALLTFQHKVLEHLRRKRVMQRNASVLKSVNGKDIEQLTANDGTKHNIRVVTHLSGQLLSALKPHRETLLQSLGQELGKLDQALTSMDSAALSRTLLWNMDNGLATLTRFSPLLENSERQDLVAYFSELYRNSVLPVCEKLRRGLIHNDANDNNILVDGDSAWNQQVVGIIDFGDMVNAYIVCEPAVAAAYAMLNKEDPLAAATEVIRGYHQTLPLTETEISVIYAMICMRLCMSVCICAHQRSLEPENKYLGISETPAWNTLQLLRDIHPRYALFVFRNACGLPPCPSSPQVVRWLTDNHGTFAQLVDVDFQNEKLLVLDTSVSSPNIDNLSNKFDVDKASRDIVRALEDNDAVAGIGRYNEYRPIYHGDQFATAGGERRTLHLGIDIFMPAGTPLRAPLAATVYGFADNDEFQDYGATIILRHQCEDRNVVFYTLYGHLSLKSLTSLKIGQVINKGDYFAWMGEPKENGQWPPHVHFQIMTDMLDESSTFVGVGNHSHADVWKSLCPDPNLILGIPSQLLRNDEESAANILSSRRQHISPSLSIAYRQPINVVRGSMQYLYDHTGRQFLDAVNNVSHVGHCHPKVVQAAQRQTRVLNTNTRYLSKTLAQFSERLLEKFPAPLEVCFFTCSGSEANDLALRLAQNYTSRRNIVILDHAYHGNLSSLIDISPYKHDGTGGSGTPSHVHKILMPDIYRGPYKANTPQTANLYADHVKSALTEARDSGGAAVFMTESVLGCGGQVVLPDEYLKIAYQYARNAGAVCIADEVQVGFGRVGSHFWGFETQDVIPDIVTLGKPIGNGQPMAAVVTTREIADAFDNGMEYFNTFGGNPVSCAIGRAVLDVIDQDKLQQNAKIVGNQLLNELRKLQHDFAIIGDVRGLGLFVGIELVNDCETLQPATAQATYIAERMKELGVLISTDGPLHNVLKIKPPLCFSSADTRRLVVALQRILQENFAQPSSTFA